jgi:hypothetical protein
MSKSMRALGAQFLLTALLMVATNQVHAGTVVTVTFSGTPTGSSTGNFSGAFAYDQSDPKTVNFEFKFVSSGFTHMVEYTTNLTGHKTGLNSTCEPFTITTSGSKVTVTATMAGTPATTVTIVLPVLVMLSGTSLPLCTIGDPAVSVFDNPPQPGSTFTLSGGSSYTGTITSVSCSQTAGGGVTGVGGGGGGGMGSPQGSSPQAPAPYYGGPYPNPAPGPVYACAPRQGCCLSRLFARRHRNCCW